MKTGWSLAIVIAASIWAAPAHASGGLFCEPVGKNGGPSLNLSMTRGDPGGIFGATLDDGGNSRTTMGEGAPLTLVQAWIDDHYLFVDIADADMMHYVARLRAKRARIDDALGAVGTLEYGGKKHAVRCGES